MNSNVIKDTRNKFYKINTKLISKDQDDQHLDNEENNVNEDKTILLNGNNKLYNCRWHQE